MQELFKSSEKQFQKFSLPPWEPKVKEINNGLIAEGARPHEEIIHKRKNSADTSEKIFQNNDKRVRVASTKNFPESTQVFLKMNFGKAVAYGSGQMIGPYHVLTCAHNIYDLDRNYGWAHEIIAYPSANGEEDIPFKGIDAVKAIIPLSWKDGQEDADIALILLEKKIGYETGWASFAYWQDEEFNDVDILVSGYPGDKPFGTLYEMKGRIKKTKKSVLHYEISTAPGQSGGPIWKRGSFPVILGVHCRAGPSGKNWNEGTRISEKYFYWITSCMEMNHAAAACKERDQGCKVESLDFVKPSNLIHLCDNNGTKYTGQYKERKVNDCDIMVPIRQGYGLAIQKNGERYKGHFYDNKRHGQGVCTYSNGSIYAGQWRDGKKEGQGTLIWRDGSYYKGRFHQDQRNGDAISQDSDGNLYIGKWEKDKKHGKGNLTNADGSSYKGEFEQNEKHGQGTYKYPNGSVYEGQWRYDRKQGQGKLTLTDGNVESYEGEFCNDFKHGKGIEKLRDGSVYTGQWKDNKKEGLEQDESYDLDEIYRQKNSPTKASHRPRKNDRVYKEDQDQEEYLKREPIKRSPKKSKTQSVIIDDDDNEIGEQLDYLINDIAGGSDVPNPSKVGSVRDKGF